MILSLLAPAAANAYSYRYYTGYSVRGETRYSAGSGPTSGGAAFLWTSSVYPVSIAMNIGTYGSISGYKYGGSSGAGKQWIYLTHVPVDGTHSRCWWSSNFSIAGAPEMWCDHYVP